MTTSQTQAVTRPRELTGDQYMELLLQRQAAFMAQCTPRPGAKVLLAPTLESFVRPGDEDLVELPAPEPHRTPVPRRYRPASYWRERIAALDAQMNDTAAAVDLGDRAAAGGVGIGRSRATRHGRRADAALSRYTALATRRDHAERMLRAATAREQKQEG